MTDWPGDIDEPIPTATLDLDIGREHELESWSTSAEIATDIPEQIRETPGMAMGTAKITLAPPATAAPGHFSPFRTGLSTANKRAALTAGFAGDEVPVITGKVVATSGEATSETLPIEIEDTFADLLGQVSLPVVTRTASKVGGYFLADTAETGLSPGWAMDTLLRSAGYPTTPMPEPNCSYSAPMQDSTFPEVSFLDQFDSTNPQFRTASWGRALYAGQTRTYMQDPPSLADVGSSMRVACYTEGSAGASELTVGTDWTITLTPGSVEIECEPTGVTVSATIAAGALVLDFTRTSATVVTVLVRQVGLPDQSRSFTVSSGALPDALIIAGADTTNRRLAAVQIAASAAAPSTTLAHVRSTDLDPSLGVLDAVPVGLSGKIMDTLREIAEAEFGAIWMSPGDVPTFRNRDSLRGVGVTPENVTSYDKLANLSWSMNTRAVRSAVEVPVHVPKIASASSTTVVAWAADSTIMLPAGQRVTWTVDLDKSVAVIGKTIAGIIAADPDPPSGSFFRANSTEANDGTTNPDTARGTVRQLGPNRLEITLIGGDYNLWLQDPNGAPALTIRCRLAVEQPEPYLARAENPGVDADVLTLPENRWRQNLPAGTELATWLAALCRTPVPVLQTIDVVPDPRRQLGAVVLIQDESVTGAYCKALVVGLERAGSPGQLTERIKVRMLPWSVAEVDAAHAGSTVGDFDADWSGYTVTDFQTQPLGRTT